MDTGPMAGLVATIVVPFAATPRAAAPIFSVMLSVVFGLITLIFMTPGHSSPACRTRRGGRPVSSVSDRGSAGLRSSAGGGSSGRPRPGRGRPDDPPPAEDRRPAEPRSDTEDTGRPPRRVRQAGEEWPGVMKIKVINPNTTESMTEKIGAAARGVAAEGTMIVAASPAMGPVSIEGHYDEAVSVLGLLEEIRKGEADGCDGYVIACFGDPGLLAAREIARGPVLGIAEAAMHAASMIAAGFTIVTTLERTRGISRQLVEAYGMARLCRNIRAADLAVLDLEREGSAARITIVEECRRALKEDHADAIVLGCAGMADLSAEIAREIGAPVVEGVTAAVKLVEALVGLGLQTSKIGELAFPLPKAYRGALRGFAPGDA